MPKQCQKRWRKRSFLDDSAASDATEMEANPNCNSKLHVDSTEPCVYNEANDYGYKDYAISSDEEESSDMPDTPEGPDGQDLAADLRAWATKHNCTREAVNELLGVLRKHGNNLPKDSRTLLKTPRKVEFEDKCGGQFTYIGISKGLEKALAVGKFPQNCRSIELYCNVDGVPLFKSTNAQFWPILCSWPNGDPFPVALFFGTQKPNSLQDYLQEFLAELNELSENGFTYEEKKYDVRLKGFVCDAPARCFLKCSKSHNGYHSCERCTIKGTRYENRMVFEAEEAVRPRDGEQFSAFDYENTHQLGISPLSTAGLDCVKDFALDYMHLVCLGVTKRILVFLKQGPPICRISASMRNRISTRLELYNGKMPSDFARQPRSLSELDRWKATEFRQFLLYTGMVVLRGIVSTSVYEHFLHLSLAVGILLDSDDERRNHYLEFAQKLLEEFIRQCPAVYGRTFTVYNVHSLLHLPQDTEHFNCSLNEVSAFPFENYLRKLKESVRNCKNPLAQAVKRMEEEAAAVRKQKPVVHSKTVSSKPKDCCFLTEDENIVFVKDIVDKKRFLCSVVKQPETSSLFQIPCESKLFNIMLIDFTKVSQTEKVLSEEQLKQKAVCLQVEEGVVVMPLLHGLHGQ